MKPIKKEDINNLNDIIMELPAFRDLKSNEMIQEVLNKFLEDLYIEQPKELFDMFEFNLNSRMQEVMFANYGIDKNYTRKIKGYLKKDLSHQLERLYQNKGSKEIFKIFGNIFENIFRRINFYNIKVYKVPTPTGFRFEYRLVPIYISDESNIITHPQIPVKQSRKYLMELENFKDYTFWPMPTNLIYIQLSIGEEVINNMNTFLDGMRGYGTTYLQGKKAIFKNRFQFEESVKLDDVEFVTAYFKAEITKKHNPDWDFNIPTMEGTYLPFEPNLGNIPDPMDPDYDDIMLWMMDRTTYLTSMQDLLLDYGKAKRNDRQEMEEIKRRWQFFLNLKKTIRTCYRTYNELVQEMETRYPLLKEEFLNALEQIDDDNEIIFDFYVYIYSIFLNGVYANPEDPVLNLNEQWVLDYVDVLFGELFIEANFLKWYFNPVMDLFIRYFFPIEMEYINDLIQKIILKDKWNAVSYDDSKLRFDVKAGESSIQTPIRGIDWKKFWLTMTDKHSYIDERSMHGSILYTPYQEEYSFMDCKYIETLSIRKSRVHSEDKFEAKILQGILPRDQRFSQRSSICFKTKGTKKYLVEVLNATIK